MTAINCVSGNVNICFSESVFSFNDDVRSVDGLLASIIFKRGKYLCMEFRRTVFLNREVKYFRFFEVEMKKGLLDFVDDSSVIVYYYLISILKRRFSQFSSNVLHYLVNQDAYNDDDLK